MIDMVGMGIGRLTLIKIDKLSTHQLIKKMMGLMYL